MAQKRQAKTHQQHVGGWGEETAARFLTQHGYAVIGRNIHTKYGEIDLLARQGTEGELVFVEVKTRTNVHFGLPEEGVDVRKVEHVGLSAAAYLEQHPELVDIVWRIDVIAIQGRPGGRDEDINIVHFENISS